MEPTNTHMHMLYHSDFLLGTRPLSQESHAHKFIWWGFAIIATLVSLRIILEYVNADMASTPAYVLHTITNYIVYPFSTTLTVVSGGGGYAFATTAVIAMFGYLLLVIALVSFLHARRSPRARIERARTLSRRRYSHLL